MQYMDVFIIFEEDSSLAGVPEIASIWRDMDAAQEELNVLASERDSVEWIDQDTKFQSGHYTAWIENYEVQ